MPRKKIPSAASTLDTIVQHFLTTSPDQAQRDLSVINAIVRHRGKPAMIGATAPGRAPSISPAPPPTPAAVSPATSVAAAHASTPAPAAPKPVRVRNRAAKPAGTGRGPGRPPKARPPVPEAATEPANPATSSVPPDAVEPGMPAGAAPLPPMSMGDEDLEA